MSYNWDITEASDMAVILHMTYATLLLEADP